MDLAVNISPNETKNASVGIGSDADTSVITGAKRSDMVLINNYLNNQAV